MFCSSKSVALSYVKSIKTDIVLVLRAIDLYFQKKNWQWNIHTTSEENLGKNEESLFGPPIKRIVQEISSSYDSSSESDSCGPDSD